METIKFHSSNGTLVVDHEGIVLKDKSSYDNDELTDIIKVDLPELENFLKMHGCALEPTHDILNVGYWSSNGQYVPPAWDWRTEVFSNEDLILLSR